MLVKKGRKDVFGMRREETERSVLEGNAGGEPGPERSKNDGIAGDKKWQRGDWLKRREG